MAFVLIFVFISSSRSWRLPPALLLFFRSLPIRGNPYISLEIHSYIASYIFLLRPIMIIAL